ncbi:hypothetical protein BDN72DRAFT_927053 [Pluteus cervinus]|uniref:Uncharacterized protein n=1 Tax=Pluteus cervinus TaxID=181527 RepID=A0ACD3AE83_9AGAR|nr:hypothetical protein BDN72DRAFT_927053 [Pluteus cervinus]
MCPNLSLDLRKLAKESLASNAPSRRLDEEQLPNATTSQKAKLADRKNEPAASASIPAPNKTTSNGVLTFYEESKLRGRKKHHQLLDVLMVRLWCAAGLSFALAQRSEWIDLWAAADPTYTPADREKLKDQIHSEAEAVNQRQIEYLRTQENLTVSYDGGTSRGHEAFWTLHVSTADRRVYFLRGRDATAESHTAEWIRDFVLEFIHLIGAPRFAAAICDSTGNTRKSRSLLEDEVPTLFGLADIAHHMNNTVKDIGKHPYFKSGIDIVRKTVTKFNKSHLGQAELKLAQKKLGIHRGLESIGKTRFASVVRAALSVQRALPVIKEVVRKGDFDLEILKRYFHPQQYVSSETMQFEMQLNQFIGVGAPFLKALTILESNEATAADVFIFWHATLSSVLNTLIELQLPAEVQGDILRILQYRHDELLGQGKLSSPIYLAATYLNPMYLNSDVLKPQDVPKGLKLPHLTSADLEGVKFPVTFIEVSRFLAKLAEDEILRGHKSEFTEWGNRSGEFKKQFISEIQHYARQQFPYNQPYNEHQGIYSWWNSLVGSDFASILPHIAMKILAIRVNSMPEERTVSTFTWLTPPLRSQLSIGTMMATTQVRQYYQTENKV